MKAVKLLFLAMLFSGSLSAQLKINSTGQVLINGQEGRFAHAPRVNINSSSTAINGGNSGLSLFNSNTTAGNWGRINFATKKSNNTEEDFVSLATQFVNKTAGSESADFHIATYSRGGWRSRFVIHHGNFSMGNHVNFYFDVGTGGIWLRNFLEMPIIYPGTPNYGSIGAESSYWRSLFVNNAYFTNHSTITSDRRVKNSIQNIDKETMQKLKQVRGVKYKMNMEHLGKSNSLNENIKIDNIYEEEKRIQLSEGETGYTAVQIEELQKVKDKEHFGFIAQELIEIFPEVVDYNEENDSYGIQYTAMIPIMLEGMKEQQAIEAQSLKIKELERKFENLNGIGSNKEIKAKNASSLINEKETSEITNAFLYQNVPNPFSVNTEIKYYIPEGVKNAALYLFSIQGKLLRSEKINTTGQGSIIINGSELPSGIYMYSLIVEGQEVDTKRMILTD